MSRNHQLAAIMFTDIAGYTALMGEDEQKAIEILTKNRQLQKPLIEAYNGKWIKEVGDGILASFPTVSDAVQAAVKIQESCQQSGEFSVRIGLHQGEVVVENGDVFGDAVNIASRLQALAPVGGIWVTEAVHHNVANKQGIETKFIKEEVLKHVKEPVRIYAVVMKKAPVLAMPVKQNTKAEQTRKIVAVLPFVNMSSDPEQEYFSDGLTEEIITDLSRLGNLLVISRSSIMTFKGTKKKVTEIATEVNARYVLEGSVRKAGNNLRITAQLIDATNDSHLWAEKYSGTIDDIFDIQEKVSRSIAEALSVNLTKEEDIRLSEHPIQDLRAYECYIRARQELWKFTEAGTKNAISLARGALDMIGENALLYATLSLAHLFVQHYGIRNDPTDLDKAYLYASRCLDLNPDLAQTQFVQGILAFKKGKLQDAYNIFKKVLTTENQNSPEALHFMIVTCCMAGQAVTARPVLEEILQVDPLTTNTYAFPGLVELYSGHIQQSLPQFKRWYEIDPYGPFTRYWYANVLVLNNQFEESIFILDTLIRDTPYLVFGKFALFLKSALQGNKEAALQHADAELKTMAATLDYLPKFLATTYALLDEKDEAVKWLNKSLDFGYAPYPLIQKIEIFQKVLKEHKGFHEYMAEIKKRSEQFVL